MSRVKSMRVAAVVSAVNSAACKALGGAISVTLLPDMSVIIPGRILIQVLSRVVARSSASFRYRMSAGC